MSPEVLVAAAAVSLHPKWQKLDEYIQAEIDKALAVLVANRDVAEMHRMQGHVQALQGFQRSVREARAVMEKRGLQAPL